MANKKNIRLKNKKTIVFLFPSLMAAFKNEILMGMAQYAQRQRRIVIRCIEEDDVDNKNAFAECDGIFTNTCSEKIINRMTATGLPIVRHYDYSKRPDMIDIGFDDRKIGTMAAEWFLRRRFKNLAYCGNRGSNDSDAVEKEGVCLDRGEGWLQMRDLRRTCHHEEKEIPSHHQHTAAMPGKMDQDAPAAYRRSVPARLQGKPLPGGMPPQRTGRA